MRYWVAALFAFLMPTLASAHEVYVLTPTQIQYGLSTAPFNEFTVALGDISAFAFWAFVGVITVFVVFFASIIRPLEKWAYPTLNSWRRYAAPVARVTLGISFIAAAYYGATYGPELPIAATFGAATFFIRLLLASLGVLLITNVYVRQTALIALGLFAIAVYAHGFYMLTYANYFGEIALLFILGSHHGATPRRGREAALAKQLAPYSFAILRVCFGVSLFYASFYAKILHNYLALQVATLPLSGHAHSLAWAFGFEPHFLVVGAALVELLIATMFILGIEIRFTSLFLLFWLSLSLFYFGESVWPHIILIGIPLAFILYGYDKYSLEGWFMKKGGREPVL